LVRRKDMEGHLSMRCWGKCFDEKGVKLRDWGTVLNVNFRRFPQFLKGNVGIEPWNGSLPPSSNTESPHRSWSLSHPIRCYATWTAERSR